MITACPECTMPESGGTVCVLECDDDGSNARGSVCKTPYLSPREHERLDRLRKRAHHLQNRIDARPRYDLSYDKAELSALCWAIAKISGKPFTTDASQPQKSESSQ